MPQPAAPSEPDSVVPGTISCPPTDRGAKSNGVDMSTSHPIEFVNCLGWAHKKTNPYGSIVIRGNCRGSFDRKFLLDERNVKEAMKPFFVGVPDVSLAIDQRSTHILARCGLILCLVIRCACCSHRAAGRKSIPNTRQ